MLRRLLLLACVAVLAVGSVATLRGEDERTLGLLLNDPRATDGYTIFSPLDGNAYLIDNNGDLVHFWDTGGRRISTPYLQEDGSIIGIGLGDDAGILRFDWDGNLLWEFPYFGPEYAAHHDLEVLPNSNVLLISREVLTGNDAIEMGRDPETIGRDFWPDKIIEVRPTGPSSGEIVWEWHVIDHLVQDFDPTKPDYGVVGDHPELVDINFHGGTRPRDWLHPNAVDYNPELDQIMFSVRHFSEFWIIDHSTTTEEAASHSGGNSGKGGDLLYRWGNPQTYDAGDAEDQQLFWQHDTQWIEPGLPGAGNILLFNNGVGRPGGAYSSVDEIVPPVDASGEYELAAGQPYGPAEALWTYWDPGAFHSGHISGVGRMPNGNTLIDSGAQGRFFEITSDGEIVWEYLNPVVRDGPLMQGTVPPASLVLDVFRIYRYPPDHPGLLGRDLTPQGPIELPKEGVETPTAPPEPVLVGDLDGDEELTSIDAALLLQYESGLEPPPDVEQADLNGDGVVDAVDAVLILQVAAGLLEEAAVGGSNSTCTYALGC